MGRDRHQAGYRTAHDVLGLLRRGGLKLVRSEDDAGVIDRLCPHLPLRGKLVAYAPSVHSETKLDCIYVILRIF
jgi:hypothetical protein